MKTHCAATVFSVSDLERALKFYTEVLGFEVDFTFGSYAGIKCGSVLLHITQAENPHTERIGRGNVYIFVDEVDKYYKTITAKGAKTKDEPKNWPYHMRDFIAYDPDGNQLTFGMEVKDSIINT